MSDVDASRPKMVLRAGTRSSSDSTCEEVSNQRVRSARILVNLMVVVRHRLRFHVANHVNHRGEA